ncbi:cupin domain-containing protein [Streptomyces sp. HSW2009]|uniref:cupin domain-containing protein n=1 Tax=Streptomyces sp. HSW2009 TaxID=3142890 RepID=UPI0032ECA23E
MSEHRFILLDAGASRPTRVPLPPAMAVKAGTEDTEGRFSLLEVVVAQEIPRHVHHVSDECVYVLDGELAVEFDDRTHTVAAGQFVLLPHGVPHALRPAGPRPPRVLQISSPGGWECFLQDMIENRTQISRQGRLDPAPLNRIAARHQITYEEPGQPGPAQAAAPDSDSGSGSGSGSNGSGSTSETASGTGTSSGQRESA